MLGILRRRAIGIMNGMILSKLTAAGSRWTNLDGFERHSNGSSATVFLVAGEIVAGRYSSFRSSALRFGLLPNLTITRTTMRLQCSVSTLSQARVLAM